MRNRPIYDVVALLARCGVGTVFLAHGWQKIQDGLTVTGQNLDTMGAPEPTAAAVYSTFVELLGGAALILGLLLPVTGALLFLDMVGALIFVHAKHGIFLVNGTKVHNGFELVLVLGLAALVFAAGGGGRLTLDHLLFGRGRADEGDDDMPPWRPVPGSPNQHAQAAYPASEPGKEQERDETRVVAPPGPVSAGEFPAPPAGDETTPPPPGTATDVVTDDSRDVIVAGKKAPKRSTGGTTPVRSRKNTRKKQPPKSGS